MKARRLSKASTREANRPTRATAENAVRTLIQWAGDDPNREGLRGTPARVVRAYEEWFAGYFEDPREYLQRTFEEVAGYDEMVLLRDIRFESHCEHHIAPIIGRVHIGYLPRRRVLGMRLQDERHRRAAGIESLERTDRRSASELQPQVVGIQGEGRLEGGDGGRRISQRELRLAHQAPERCLLRRRRALLRVNGVEHLLILPQRQ